MHSPFVLGFSPHPPVSVCGTGAFTLDSSFSRQCGITHFGTLIFPIYHTFVLKCVLYYISTTVLGHALPVACLGYPPVSLPLS